MAKLRHIALIVPDPEKAAKFFEDAFDMKVAGKARRGLYVSDGTVNVALLKQEGDEKVGIYHFGEESGGRRREVSCWPARAVRAGGDCALLLRGKI
jgi:catechol 2,3-dioxygenase-like lactoylglutathione lyase family enzyme